MKILTFSLARFLHIFLGCFNFVFFVFLVFLWQFLISFFLVRSFVHHLFCIFLLLLLWIFILISFEDNHFLQQPLILLWCLIWRNFSLFVFFNPFSFASRLFCLFMEKKLNNFFFDFFIFFFLMNESIHDSYLSLFFGLVVWIISSLHKANFLFWVAFLETLCWLAWLSLSFFSKFLNVCASCVLCSNYVKRLRQKNENEKIN